MRLDKLIEIELLRVECRKDTQYSQGRKAGYRLALKLVHTTIPDFPDSEYFIELRGALQKMSDVYFDRYNQEMDKSLRQGFRKSVRNVYVTAGDAALDPTYPELPVSEKQWRVIGILGDKLSNAIEDFEGLTKQRASAYINKWNNRG